ncbi:MAG: thioredoxin family protein [Verrucomicrobiota bacterium]
MRLSLITILAVLAAALTLQARNDSTRDAATQGQLGWFTDYAAAKAKANELNRPLLINFTGSDWCHACVELERNVFTKSDFKKFAAENVVLLKIDFPARKKQSEALQSQNAALERAYRIQGFPTVVLADEQGREKGRVLGLRPGGASGYVSHLKKMLN